MTRGAAIAGGAFAIVLVLLALAAGYRAFEPDIEPAVPVASVPPLEITPAVAPETYQGAIYGRVTTDGGEIYEGRLRWGRGNQEAFWGDYFNGSKQENPWIAHVPPERLPMKREPIEILGVRIATRKAQADVDRQFLARFGEITRIESRGKDVRITLKSETVYDIDRYFASDFDDGVRVWDGKQGIVDLRSMRIRAIELLPTARPGGDLSRLHGTVRTRQGDFTGFVLWDRTDCVGSDKLDGSTAEGRHSLRFDTIRSIARRSPDSSLVTLLDGSEVVLSYDHEIGIHVDDPRYGRARISWDAFERVDFSPGDSSGPAYGDFPPGRPITGSLTTRAGRRLAGRLVYDLNESETTDTLDASSQGVDYNLPFGLISSIMLEEGDSQHARVILQSGEELRLERTGDLADRNGGMLVLVEGSQRPEYVPWADVEQLDFDRPAAMYPPFGPRGLRKTR